MGVLNGKIIPRTLFLEVNFNFHLVFLGVFATTRRKRQEPSGVDQSGLEQAEYNVIHHRIGHTPEDIKSDLLRPYITVHVTLLISRTILFRILKARS